MMIIKKNILFAALLIVFASFAACKNNNHAVNKSIADTTSKTAANNAVEVYTFPVDKGYGYAIFVNNKAFIRQDCIPVIQGNKPFASKEDAQKTGNLVAQKIRNNNLPTLTQQELRQLAIIQ